MIGSIPNTVTRVSLKDGFNQKLTPGILPGGIEWLYLGDIKQELIIGSIRPSIIPDGIKGLYFGGIKQELMIGSIPNTVTFVSLLNGFNQKLTPGILPDGVKELLFGDTKQELIIGSIPNTVTRVSLLDGFNQKLTPGILPYGVKSLKLGDIKQELMIGSIPNTVKEVIVFKDCKLIPCCIQCISSKGEHHGHKTDSLESTSNILPLMNNFRWCVSKRN
ncbi:hypothetical protein ACTFIT_001208 [Dictyostelium discoideum]